MIRMGVLAGLVFCLIFVGCSDGHRARLVSPAVPTVPAIPSFTMSQLLAAPDSLRIGGVTFPVGMAVNRDFFPDIDTTRSPLRAFTQIDSSASGPRPSITAVYIWVIRDSSEVWSATAQEQTLYYPYWYWATNGPVWPTGTVVDMVVGVRTSPKDVFLVLHRRLTITAVL